MINPQFEHYYQTHPLPEDGTGPGPLAEPLHKSVDMPNPTPEQIEDPVFNAIWNVIKTWDVNVPDYYFGYCGATGSHVMLIWDAIKQVQSKEREQHG